MQQTKVCIIGAGPGGAATALKLSYLGIPCVLLDKAVFPRDKVCGDAVSGKVLTLLNRLDPELLVRFRKRSVAVDVWGIRFVQPNYRSIDIPFQLNYSRDPDAAPGYVARRSDFDHFLIEEVKKRDNIDFREGIEVKDYTRSARGYQLSNSDRSFQLEAQLLILANGAHSSFSRKHAGLEKDSRHHAGAVRAYFSNVQGLAKDNFIELHFLKEYLPGYLWIFPLPNGSANVGLGMRSDYISKRKLNLKKELLHILDHYPSIRARFVDARLEGPIKGYGLPLGSRSRTISGDHFMLVGDAGHLIDPLTGEGIGNAFYSGFIAAEQAVECLQADNFSAAFLEAYDKRVARVLGSEMKLSYKLQQMAQYPWLVNTTGRIIRGNQRMLHVLSNMVTDFSLREQLVKPWFWIKMAINRKH